MYAFTPDQTICLVYEDFYLAIDYTFYEFIKDITMKKNKQFIPDWIDTPPKPGTTRSIFKWGAPNGFKHPNHRLFETIKEKFGMTDDDFRKKIYEGNEPVTCDVKVRLEIRQIEKFKEMVGPDNVSYCDYDRVKYSTGKTMEETLKLRQGISGDVNDIVVHPRSKEDIQKIVTFCNQEKIPVYVYGGGSSVTKGLISEKGGVTLVMSTHMNRVLSFNETNQTITVESGIMGPAYESILNNAPEKLGAEHQYTCGHYPQSFEYSSVGGWIVTLGSGQASSYYGDMYDIVLSQEYITPTGNFRTLDFPATATGPKINDIMKGNEGSFGVLINATLKIFKHRPKNRHRFAFIFPTWEGAVDASREIIQGEFGKPAVFRISDAEETDMALKMYGIEGTPISRLISYKGYRPMRRCLCIGTAEGEQNFAGNVKKQIKKICRKYGAMYISGYPVKNWEHGRYIDPYIREDLNDFGIMIDTLEAGVTWDNLHRLHQNVREYIKSRPQTICMTHASHFYPQGTNLYFIFIARMNDIEEYLSFQEGIIDRIVTNGGSLSHHHGVGKMISPWMEQHIGTRQMDVLRALKKHFDPNNIMNPGGTLGLDLEMDKIREPM
jgi:alkyldihydroxyacetonephosphate synthase